jgi:anti-repressor protein
MKPDNNTTTHKSPWHMPVDKEELEFPIFNILSKDEAQWVDLRELHRELESKQEFSNWAKTKLKHFTQFVDYQPADELVSRPQGGSYKKKGFFASLDCAKHIALMEQTERGKQVRQYFIKCEKALKAMSQAKHVTLREYLVMNLELLDKAEEQARQLGG